MRISHLCILAVLVVSACAHHTREDALSSGDKYVAMGSSFAAGPGITESADDPPHRCGRSQDNYPHQLARRLGLSLIDVSCSGATTAHILGAWNELPPQIDAVDADTRLVTITIGGNDLGYIGGLIGMSCARVTDGARCPPVSAPSEQDYRDVEAHMTEVAAEVRARAPEARLVFVDYPTVLPEMGVCELTPLSEEEADAARDIAYRLEEITARVAAAAGADLVRASALSRAHDACADDAWMIGFPPTLAENPTLAPYHPNLDGMTATADALEQLLTS